ncbi:indolepyruvate ferredoxin oxidoreductase subunit alpha [bacterium]|nr:indolepyruvate ferredoxin oxidoreductase subunit alpha [bacterium]
MKQILSGNESVARGCYEYGVHIATAYPGTPSTEVLENIAKFPEINSEWCPNEKVAFEVAMGAAFEGARSIVVMKHVGLNVAADPFVSVSLIGAPGGLVVVSADDPGMHSSQNEQDNRFYAKFAGYPCIEPSDSQEAKEFIGQAFDISIRFDVPVLYRMTTRVCHSKGIVSCGERNECGIAGFFPNPQKFVVLPSHARLRRQWADDRLQKLMEFVETSDLNRIDDGNGDIGIITHGVTYQYVKEIIPDFPVFKCGITYPLPVEAIRKFAHDKKQLLIIEELEPFIESELKTAGIRCEGKKYWPHCGEMSPDTVTAGLILAGIRKAVKTVPVPEPVIPRPPVFCPGCPHRGVYYILSKLKARVCTDIGCYTLGALPPLNSGDTCVEMGASIGVAVGMAKARKTGRGIVATIGDSTFLHSGMTGLLNAVNDNAGITVIIMDNSITAMTGGQLHPGSGRHLNGSEAPKMQFAALCQALGCDRIKVIDPYEIKQTESVLKEALNSDELSVIITNRPCALYPHENRRLVRQAPFRVNEDQCIGCHACMRVSCPAVSESDNRTAKGKTKSHIDTVLCTGCSVCAQVCPVNAIERMSENNDFRKDP